MRTRVWIHGTCWQEYSQIDGLQVQLKDGLKNKENTEEDTQMSTSSTHTHVHVQIQSYKTDIITESKRIKHLYGRIRKENCGEKVNYWLPGTGKIQN